MLPMLLSSHEVKDYCRQRRRIPPPVVRRMEGAMVSAVTIAAFLRIFIQAHGDT